MTNKLSEIVAEMGFWQTSWEVVLVNCVSII
jgi:hypothetical protein